MQHVSKFLIAAAVVAGAAALPTIVQAESAKGSKAEPASAATKNQASVDEFEENRRAHMQKSKENNTKKGAE
ncbi:hypothetical protein MKK50_03265 [Methylobacterium sp. J-043]|nr:hypothetical protein [Methylobacterium sp. J-043]